MTSRFVRRRAGLLVATAILVALGFTVLSFLLPAGRRPTLIAENPLFDWASATEGDLVANEFVVRNEGAADVAIRKIIADCSCTTSSNPTVIPARSSVSISVTVDTYRHPGEYSRTVSILTDLAEQPRLDVTMFGEVLPIVMLDPEQVSLAGFSGETVSASIEILPFDDLGLTVELPESIDERLSARVDPLESGEGFRCTIMATHPALAEPSRSRTEIELVAKMSDGDERRIYVPVTLAIDPRVVSVPAKRIRFNATREPPLSDAGTEFTKEIVLQSAREDCTFSVESVSSAAGGGSVLRLSVIEASPALARIAVTLTQPPTTEAIRERVDVHVRDPDARILSYDVLALPPVQRPGDQSDATVRR